MIIQILNLSDLKIFKKYSDKYRIFREVHQLNLFALEIRDLQSKLAENVQKIILKEKEICYKRNNESKNIDLLITGSLSSFKELSKKVLASGDEDLGYKIVNVIKRFSDYDDLEYQIGNKTFSFDRPYVMGILNITEDSFSDGGLFYKSDDAVNHALEMIDDGADIIDIGGESTRPGAKPVSAEKEIEKIIPVLQKILNKKPETIVSVDTTKSAVAEEALKNGAKIINDISGFNFDQGLLEIIKKYDAGYVLMHIKGTPIDMQNDPVYDDLISEIYDYFTQKLFILSKKKISNVFIDPGIGFGKTISHNFELLKRLQDFKCLGYPLLIGLSRKSFIGKTLNLETGQRDMPTAVLEAIAISNGARIIRTHNVKNGVKVCKLLNNLL